ncbi:homocysteine S-methyltransferase [Tessaracoccus caeni]|uniref:homocysteine S-methyltransferase n=1 Tax=Tessaracoccus caeni TaxID=3031239 RepID=UPI0023DA7476|nr:homocysteine S-methyltransferase [Tessaracoccus caeni]MDF1489101.1 homocysteine S-methyltransferase [Tessaracoccus caeni]
MTASDARPNSIAEVIAEHRSRGAVIVLDGGLGTELEQRGCDLNHPLWSARVLMESPDVVTGVHKDYFDAGASIVSSASYQATPLACRAQGMSDAEAIDLLEHSVRLVTDARDQCDASGDERLRWVAGSVGPYGAYLADGSEYRGDYEVPHDELKEFHRARIAALVSAGADLLACETIPQLAEAQALRELIDEFGVPAWMSFTLRDEEHISDGTSIARIAELVDDSPNVVAVGINCVPLKRVSPALRVLAAHTSKPLIAYPNSGETYDATTHTWRAAPSGSTLADNAAEWSRLGAVLLGGCCRTTPADIAALAHAVGV